VKAPQELERDVPLAPRTTLELGGRAEYFLAARTDEALHHAMAWAQHEGLPVTFLGGGSNAIVPDEGVRGLVIAMESRGVTVDRSGEKVRVRVAAGEDWDPFVARAVGEGWAGLECLAGIPGKVGATPIQNVGAYGQEVSHTVVSVGCLDRTTGETVQRSASECAFGYRDSDFKQRPGRYVVTEVTFDLVPGGAPTLAYRELVERAPSDPSLEAVRALVVELRRGKSMVLDPSDPNRRSAGSFFTNPIAGAEQVAAVEREAARRALGPVPQWAVEGGTKLAAGWLIERAGFPKGRRKGAVGQSSKHALALVHHGGGTTAELLAYAEEIADGVREVFGVTLEREPRLLGTDG
jgi:UDP-N-acetylmuramate dehydrogenase